MNFERNFEYHKFTQATVYRKNTETPVSVLSMELL